MQRRRSLRERPQSPTSFIVEATSVDRPTAVLVLRACHGDAHRAIAALSSPLIDFPISQATGIVFTISGASDMTLKEVNEAAEAIYQMSHPDANIIFGAQVDEDMGSVLSITVVATGFRE